MSSARYERTNSRRMVIRADNLRVLPTCLDCIACQDHDIPHCRYLIEQGLCRTLIWRNVTM